MDRRNFLKTLAAGLVGSTLDVDICLSQTTHLTDSEFVTFVKFTIEMMVTNPAQSAIITNITEDE